MAIQKFELDKANDLDKTKLPIQTINGKFPDKNGNISVETGAGENDILAAADKAINERVVNTGQVDIANVMTAIVAVEASLSEKLDASSIHIVEEWHSEYSWYRKYSDGWIEQGGRKYCTTKNKTAITFPHTFTGTKYGIFFTVERDTSTSPEYCDDATVTTVSITKTSVNAYMYDTGNNSYSAFVRWHACGY